MASRARQSDTATDAAPQTDEQGQVVVPAVKTADTLVHGRYASGTGMEPGQAASKDTWLDVESGKVVNKAPERGQQLTIKGQPVEPWAARVVAQGGTGQSDEG